MQTPEGIIKMRATMKAKYGLTEDGRSAFYTKVGAIGGSVKNPLKGFGSNRELAVEAGRKGGIISKRRKAERALYTVD